MSDKSEANNLIDIEANNLIDLEANNPYKISDPATKNISLQVPLATNVEIKKIQADREGKGIKENLKLTAIHVLENGVKYDKLVDKYYKLSKNYADLKNKFIELESKKSCGNC